MIERALAVLLTYPDVAADAAPEVVFCVTVISAAYICRLLQRTHSILAFVDSSIMLSAGISAVMAHGKGMFLLTISYMAIFLLYSSRVVHYEGIPQADELSDVKNNRTYCAWMCSHGLQLRTLQATDNLYVLQSDEALDVAVQEFNSLLQCVARAQDYHQQNVTSNLRTCSLKTPPFGTIRNQPVHRAIGNGDHAPSPYRYFGITKLEPRILTIALSWKSRGKSNWQTIPALVDTYYPGRNVTQPCTAKTKCDAATSNRTECETQFIHALPSECIDNLHALERPEASWEHESTVHEAYPLYVHIIKWGTVDEWGSVRVGSTEVIPSQCKVTQFKGSARSQKLKEVFVISQFWGNAVYHARIENFPRLAPYLSFLKKYPQIKIHAKAKVLRDYLPLVGLDPRRLVFGQVRADVIYLPQGGGCGTLHPISGRLLHEQYARYIQQHISSAPSARSPPPSANPSSDGATRSPQSSPATTSDVSSIILIQRTSKRWLAQHGEVQSLLTQIAPIYNLTVEVYSDKKLPSLKATMSMFSRAKLIVGPHGAGLANVMFSRAGTRVIEILCNPGANLCYRQLHTTLGQPYVGLLSVKRSGDAHYCGKLTVDLTYLKMLVKSLLEK